MRDPGLLCHEPFCMSSVPFICARDNESCHLLPAACLARSALWLQGACAFHWAAMEAAADWLQSTCISGSDSNRAAQQSDAALLCSLSRPARRFPDSIQLCNAITRVAAHCPQLATPRLCAMIKEWCAMAAEVRRLHIMLHPDCTPLHGCWLKRGLCKLHVAQRAACACMGALHAACSALCVLLGMPLRCAGHLVTP